MQSPKKPDRGAEMVEFAIIVPVLLMLVLGIIEFGFLLHEQATLAGAAREGAREMAIHNNVGDAQDAVIGAVDPLVVLTADNVTIAPATCSPGESVTVTVSYAHDSLTGILAFLDGDSAGAAINLTGVGVMRCGG